jgi:cob(I)alamin adenosyltransferase
MQLPSLQTSDVQTLESAMDKLDEVLPPMKNFVLPGGHITVSHVHVARCICRRAERSIVFLHEQSPVEIHILEYMNRLSDYLFTLSRAVSAEAKATETPWIPRM